MDNIEVYLTKVKESYVCEIFANGDYMFLDNYQAMILREKLNECGVINIGELLNKCVEVLGVKHEITLMVSQMLDEEIKEIQKKELELHRYKQAMMKELIEPSEFQRAYERSMKENE